MIMMMMMRIVTTMMMTVMMVILMCGTLVCVCVCMYHEHSRKTIPMAQTPITANTSSDVAKSGEECGECLLGRSPLHTSDLMYSDVISLFFFSFSSLTHTCNSSKVKEHQPSLS